MKDEPPTEWSTARHGTEVPSSRALVMGGTTLSARARSPAESLTSGEAVEDGRRRLDGSCPSTCYSYTCEYWVDRWSPQSAATSCAVLATTYGCDCAGCSSCATPSPTPHSTSFDCELEVWSAGLGWGNYAYVYVNGVDQAVSYGRGLNFYHGARRSARRRAP